MAAPADQPLPALTPAAPRPRIHFVDWMKAVGMFIIVYGHSSASRTVNFTTWPLQTKQLGVALFMFVIGWSLANETRRRDQVGFNRLFPILFWGAIGALLQTAIMLPLSGDPYLGNYKVFMLGINVFDTGFPRNPTTWFIGTYIHIVLLWMLFGHRLRVTKATLSAVIVFEVLFRAVFMADGLKPYPMFAYMFITNWLSCLLLGMYCCQQSDRHDDRTRALPLFGGVWLLLIAFGAAVYAVLHPSLGDTPINTINYWFQNPQHSRPRGSIWFHLADHHTFDFTLARSAMITFMYLAHTWLLFQIFRRLPGLKAVRFYAEQSIFIFIAHMPLIFFLQGEHGLGTANHLTDPAGYLLRVAVQIGTGFFAMGVLAWIATKLLQPTRLRNFIWQRLEAIRQRGKPAPDPVEPPKP